MDDPGPRASPPKATTELLTVADLAQIFQVSERTIRGLVSRAHIPYCRIANKVRFAPEHIAEIKAMFEVRPITPMRGHTTTRRRRIS